jgi:hypothetical protein
MRAGTRNMISIFIGLNMGRFHEHTMTIKTWVYFGWGHVQGSTEISYGMTKMQRNSIHVDLAPRLEIRGLLPNSWSALI